MTPLERKTMSDFAKTVNQVIDLQIIIGVNQVKFAIIRDKIDRRWIPLPTPGEMMKMSKLLKENSKLIKASEKDLLKLKANLKADRPQD